METYNSLEKGWIASFESADAGRIIKTLYEVRISGSIKMLPIILKMLNRHTAPEVKNEIIRLVSELKSPEAVPVIARSLEENDFGNEQDALVAACWQSGLDFSSHLKIFTGWFIRGDYKTALEAFTVIEESVGNASDDEINACIRYLREAELMVSEEKLPLFRELQKVIEGI